MSQNEFDKRILLFKKAIEREAMKKRGELVAVEITVDEYVRPRKTIAEHTRTIYLTKAQAERRRARTYGKSVYDMNRRAA